MSNSFETCCYDYELVRKTSQCDRINCLGNHNPEFSVYFHKANNESCYCLNLEQLGQYWHFIVKDRDTFCPSSCGLCQICKEISHVFSELKDAYFFTPRTYIFNDNDMPYEPVA